MIGSFFSNSGKWIGFINFLFSVGLLLLMAGGALFVLKGGMFDGIIYSFHRFYTRTSKLEEYVSEQTGESLDTSFNNSFRDLYIYPIIISGGALFIFTLIASVI